MTGEKILLIITGEIPLRLAETIGPTGERLFILEETPYSLIITGEIPLILAETVGATGETLSGRAIATPYLGMALVFWGFGRFQVSETAIKQTQNLKLMR